VASSSATSGRGIANPVAIGHRLDDWGPLEVRGGPLTSLLADRGTPTTACAVVSDRYAAVRRRGQRNARKPTLAEIMGCGRAVGKLDPGQPMQATLDALAQDPRILHLCVELALAGGSRRSRPKRTLRIVMQVRLGQRPPRWRERVLPPFYKRRRGPHLSPGGQRAGGRV